MRRMSVANRKTLMEKLDEFRRNHVWVNNNVVVRILGEPHRAEVNHEMYLLDKLKRLTSVIVRCVPYPGGPVNTDVCWQLLSGTLAIREKKRKR